MLSTFRFIKRLFYNYPISRPKSSGTTAGILIIGNEILKGINDVNTPFLIKELNEINVEIKKVSIVPDDIDAIAEEVANLSSNCTFVLTSGGIGPTHDDVTYEAIAKACNDKLELNEVLFKKLVNYFGAKSKDNPGIIKYSHVPKSANINFVDINHDNKSIKYPIISIKNIYIFPGVPVLLQKSFNALKSKFAQGQSMYAKEIFVDLDEFSVIGILNDAVNEFKNVRFGSYPIFYHNYYKVKLLLESECMDDIEKAYSYFEKLLPVHSLVNIRENILSSAKDDVYLFCSKSSRVQTSISTIVESLQNYATSELCVCFNGGKDCTVLLYLLYACIQKLKPREWNNVNFLYIKNGEYFEEIDNFVESTVKLYDINLKILQGDLKQALCEYLTANSNVKAMLMGARKCDPGSSELNYFSPTDSGWPEVMRVLPVLDWTHSEIWSFIRGLQLPYCILYDRGYTSLGIKSRTVQNPALLLKSHDGFQSYRPAYMLKYTENERNGRL